MTLPYIRRDSSPSTRELLALAGVDITTAPFKVYYLADEHPSQNATYWIFNTATGASLRAELKYAHHHKSLDEEGRDSKVECDAEAVADSIWRLMQGDTAATATEVDQVDTSQQVWQLVFVTDSGS